jgi:hypothetical protein
MLLLELVSGCAAALAFRIGHRCAGEGQDGNEYRDNADHCASTAAATTATAAMFPTFINESPRAHGPAL